MVRVILKGAISSPAEVALPAVDEAIGWVQDKGSIRWLARGADLDAHSSQFEVAAFDSGRGLRFAAWLSAVRIAPEFGASLVRSRAWHAPYRDFMRTTLLAGFRVL